MQLRRLTLPVLPLFLLAATYDDDPSNRSANIQHSSSVDRWKTSFTASKASISTPTAAGAAMPGPTTVAPSDAFPEAPVQNADGVSWRARKDGDVRCAYRTDELIAPLSEAANLSSTIGATLLFSILADVPPGAPRLALYALPPAAPDPLDLAASPPAPLVAGELWPNYVIGFTPGWAFAPGNDPSPAAAPTRVYVPANSGNAVSILVVDTGFLAPGGSS
jgi:hypothetical protein